MNNPLNQFLIKPIFDLKILGINVSFTNSSLCMMAITGMLCGYMVWLRYSLKLVPTKTQVVFESLYTLIQNMIKENAGEKARSFFPLVFSVFIFVLSCNIFGMLPFSFTVTSHIAVTFALAAFLFCVITVTGFIRHGVKFLSLFLPKGTPWWLAPLMIIIELCAYLTRPISLSLRLAANMTAGHVLLKVIAFFASSMTFAFKFVPVAFITILIGFELCVAILQSYIFAILICVYLNDAINLH